MKHIMYAALLSLTLFSCRNLQPDSFRDYIPGTYTHSYKDGFAAGRDTFIISLLDDQGSSYVITHRMNYQQNLDGKLLPRVDKTVKWTGVYDKEHRQLVIQNQEKTFSFLPEKGILLTNGGAEYRKMRQPILKWER